MDIEAIKSLIKGGQYDEALEACQQLTENRPELKYDVLRQKSYLYSRQGKYKAAVNELSSIINTGEARISDYHLAAFWALFDEQLKSALDWYLITLQLGEDQNETWFRYNTLCSIAYIYMKFGEYEKATFFLDKVESDDEDPSFFIPLPNEGILGRCEVQQLRNEIKRRAAEEK